MNRGCPVCGAVYSVEAEFCLNDGARLLAGDPILGRTIGPYRVVAELGAGAIGAVYEAEAPGESPKKRVALKVLKAEAAHKRDLVKRFRREAETVRKIRHPNVVAVVDSGEDGTLLYLAMELVLGKSLERVLRDGPLPPERTASIGRQIALGLSAAHGMGFVHRDLKPSNVMLEPGDKVKLVDFGVVGFAEDAAEITRLTRDGVTVGTPAYMAPEQMSTPTVGPEADLYALGTVLFEMLSGQPPFRGPLREVVLKHMAEPPPELPLHGGLGPLVARLLIKDPAMRSRDAIAIAFELEEIEKDLSSTRIIANPLPKLGLLPRAAPGDPDRTDETPGGPGSMDSRSPTPESGQHPTPTVIVLDPAEKKARGPSLPSVTVRDQDGASLTEALPTARAAAPSFGARAPLSPWGIVGVIASCLAGGLLVLGLMGTGDDPPAPAPPPPVIAKPEPPPPPPPVVITEPEPRPPPPPPVIAKPEPPPPPPPPLKTPRSKAKPPEPAEPPSHAAVKRVLDRIKARLEDSTARLDAESKNELFDDYLELSTENEKNLEEPEYARLIARAKEVERKLTNALRSSR